MTDKKSEKSANKEPQQALPLEDLLGEDEHKGNVGSWLSNTFISGLLLIIPAVVTYYFIKVVVLALDETVVNWFPEQLQPQTYLPFGIPGVGLIAAAIVILALGIFARNVIGRRIVKAWDNLMDNIPGVSPIYKAVRQVTETLANSKSSFREVVLLEYPKEECWSIGFVTNKTKGLIQTALEAELGEPAVIVFVPTTPNPTSGFLLLVPQSKIIPLDMTVEQGLKAIVSVGMVTPTVAEAKAALKAEKSAAKGKK